MNKHKFRENDSHEKKKFSFKLNLIVYHYRRILNNGFNEVYFMQKFRTQE